MGPLQLWSHMTQVTWMWAWQEKVWPARRFRGVENFQEFLSDRHTARIILATYAIRARTYTIWLMLGIVWSMPRLVVAHARSARARLRRVCVALVRWLPTRSVMMVETWKCGITRGACSRPSRWAYGGSHLYECSYVRRRQLIGQSKWEFSFSSSFLVLVYLRVRPGGGGYRMLYQGPTVLIRFKATLKNNCVLK